MNEVKLVSKDDMAKIPCILEGPFPKTIEVEITYPDGTSQIISEEADSDESVTKAMVRAFNAAYLKVTGKPFAITEEMAEEVIVHFSNGKSQSFIGRAGSEAKTIANALIAIADHIAQEHAKEGEKQDGQSLRSPDKHGGD